jgi:putative DNA-invertase from lambdoid prophage Rac
MDKNVAIYVRVSTQDQNLENQINPLVEYCKRMGWNYELFQEKESTRKSRPIQWDLYNRLLRKEFDGLVIYKFDRWARSTKELIEHIDNLLSKDILIFSYSENIDLSSSMGRAMLTIMSAFAQLERDLIRERTLAGLARARAQGKTLGRPRTRKLRKGVGKQGGFSSVKEINSKTDVLYDIPKEQSQGELNKDVV